LSLDQPQRNALPRSAPRVRLCRLRKRRGELRVTISVTRYQVERLRAQGYDCGDRAVDVGQAIETFMMDALA
jgi:hypothetical protein